MGSESPIDVALIVAMAENRVIGRQNQLPWYLPNDLRYFKSVTMGKPVVMGRKTFESIGRPLPGRSNVVVTSNAEFSAEGVIVANDVDQALRQAKAIARAEGQKELMIIGGAQLYEELLPRVSRLYLTQVHADVEGDAYFPDFEVERWRQVSKDDFSATESCPYAYSFLVLEKLPQE